MRCALEYDGRDFCGFQSQPSGCGVQDALERALAAIAGRAGARDGRRAHRRRRARDVADRALRRAVARPQSAWVRGVNAHLPRVGGRAVVRAGRRRFPRALRGHRAPLHVSAAEPRRAARPAARPRRLAPSRRSTSTRCARPRSMLVGTHDFSSFRAAGCQAKSPVKTLRAHPRGARRRDRPLRRLRPTHSCITWCATSSARWSTSAPASAPPAWIGRAAARRATARAGAPTFAADGLYFTGADYDARFALPPTRARRSGANRMTRSHDDRRARADACRACARASRSAASRASTTRARRRTRAPMRSASCSGPARRASSHRRRRAAIVAALPPYVTRRRPLRRSRAAGGARGARRGAARPAAIPRQRAGRRSAARSAAAT